MNKMDFIVKEDVVDIPIEGEIFKYKLVNSGDELDWVNDYIEDKMVVVEGKEVIKKVQNLGKLSVCKLRNIIEIPYSFEELKQIISNNSELKEKIGLEKEFKDFSGDDKILFFRKFDGTIYNQLINAVDKINKHKKKS